MAASVALSIKIIVGSPIPHWRSIVPEGDTTVVCSAPHLVHCAHTPSGVCQNPSVHVHSDPDAVRTIIAGHGSAAICASSSAPMGPSSMATFVTEDPAT